MTDLLRSKAQSGPILDKMRKNIITLFKEVGLTITIDTNLTETDFLDVTFNLAMGKFFPFRKRNSIPLYIKRKIKPSFNNHKRPSKNDKQNVI